MLHWIWLKGLVLILLGGCAATSMQPVLPVDWEHHLQQLQTLSHWRASGKVALRSTRAQETATLVWRQAGESTKLQLSGPFGAGATQIYSDGRQLTIERGNDTRTLDVSTPVAIAHNTGWDLPLRSLPHWLKGMPDPHASSEQLETDPATGYLTHLQQHGWTIDFEQYQVPDSIALPGRLRLVKHDTRVTLLIRQWQLYDR